MMCKLTYKKNKLSYQHINIIHAYVLLGTYDIELLSTEDVIIHFVSQIVNHILEC